MFSGFAQTLLSGQYPLSWCGHLVAGDWQNPSPSKDLRQVRNPSRDSVIMEFQPARTEHVQQAVVYALQHLASGLSLAERVSRLGRLKAALADAQDLIVRAMAVESGKPLWEAQEELTAALRYLDMMHKDGEQWAEKIRTLVDWRATDSCRWQMDSWGVGAVYLPFVAPLITFTHLVSAAAIAGAPLILVSSAQAAAVGTILANAVMQSAMNDSVQVLSGDFETLRLLAQQREVRLVYYSGSWDHCEDIRAVHRSVGVERRLILQSGGKNSLIIDEGADLPQAVRSLMYGAYRSAGQLCSSVSWVFVQRKVLEGFKEMFVPALAQLHTGPTDGPSEGSQVRMGPLYSQKAVDKFLRFQTMAAREAESTWSWGKKHADFRQGFFVSPGAHLMKHFDPQSAYQTNVMLGPDIAIFAYDKLSDAFQWAAHTRSSLAVGYHGGRTEEELRGMPRQAPNLFIGSATVDPQGFLPLPGRDYCGHHIFHGPALALYFLQPRAWQISTSHEHLAGPWS